MQRVGDAVMPREDSMSRNMAVINGRFYRGECGIPGTLPINRDQTCLLSALEVVPS